MDSDTFGTERRVYFGKLELPKRYGDLSKDRGMLTLRKVGSRVTFSRVQN